MPAMTCKGEGHARRHTNKCASSCLDGVDCDAVHVK